MLDKRHLLPAVAMLALLSFAACSSDRASDPLEDCIQHIRLGMHNHVLLTMTVDGQPLRLPSNMAVSAQCMRPIHTHEDANVIHIEHLEPLDFTLGDFFKVAEMWGDFDPLTGKRVVRAVIDGQPYEGDYATIPLTDGSKVSLEVESR